MLNAMQPPPHAAYGHRPVLRDLSSNMMLAKPRGIASTEVNQPHRKMELSTGYATATRIPARAAVNFRSPISVANQ